MLARERRQYIALLSDWPRGVAGCDLGANKKMYVEKPGDSFGRFQKAVKKMLSVPKEEIDKWEAEYQRTKKTVKKQDRPKTQIDDGVES